MLIFTTLKVAWRSLVATPLRSFLAILGVIIGVGAVISMLALGAGARKDIIARITAMGTDILIVRAGQGGHRGVSTGPGQNLTLDDAEAILNDIPATGSVSPVIQGNVQAKRFNQNMRTQVQGVAVPWFTMRNFTIEKGRSFTDRETDTNATVAVIGSEVARTLFPEEEAIGKSLKMNGMNFQVVGLLKSKGDQGWFNPDDMVVIPFTTAMGRLLGQDKLREIDILAQPGEDLTELQTSVEALLRKRHRTAEGAEDDFHVRNQAELLTMATDMTRTFTILLGGIAGISLLVGGIGIMNVMLVTVTERTREIGIRKAIGARERDIMRQFLIESILISGCGGFLGAATGIGIALAIQQATSFSVAIEPGGVLLAFSFSMGVGVFFGWYPARRAARMEPSAALRHE